MVICCVAGMSDDIRRVCRKFNIRVVFKSRRTLCSMLTKIKDTLPLGKQSNVVSPAAACSQVYIGETKQRLETRPKEHRDACERGMMEKSAVAEHALENHHQIDLEETTVLDRGRGQALLVKEALHSWMTPSEEHFNQDKGLNRLCRFSLVYWLVSFPDPPVEGGSGDENKYWPITSEHKSHRCYGVGMMEKSVVAEHALENHHWINLEETTVLDHGRGQELAVGEGGPAQLDDTLRGALQLG